MSNELSKHDPRHPYVQRFVGCGHGRLFTEPCVDCEIAGLMDQYKRTMRTAEHLRNKLRALGVPALSLMDVKP